jgi:hypothetical protein
VPDDRFRELVAEFPLDPITDEQAYRTAIPILDRLFAVGECRSRGETAYFREVARLAAEYEESLRSN